MTAELVIRYFHFLGILTLAGAILGQAVLLRPELERRTVATLSTLDKIYALSVLVVLGGGFLLWFWVGKPAAFYSKNPLFHLKITLFLIIGLVSIYPTLFFNKQREGAPDDIVPIPPLLRWSVRIELFLLALMPLLATLMARGIGIP
jgi:putative membrane protein